MTGSRSQGRGSRATGLQQIVLATIFFGLIPVMASEARKAGLSPEAAALWRYAVPAILLAKVMITTLCQTPDRMTLGLLACGMGVGIGTCAYFFALRHIPLTTATTIYYSFPAMTIFVGAMLFGVRPQAPHIAAVVMIFAGVAIALDAGSDSLNIAIAALSFLAPLSFAMVLNMLAHTGDRIPPIAQLATLCWGCTLVLLPLALWEPSARWAAKGAAAPQHLLPTSTTGYLLLVGIGVFGMMVPALLTTMAIKAIGPTLAGIIASLEFIVALAASALLLRAPITLSGQMIFGIALIVAAALLSAVARPPAHSAAPD